MKLKERFTGIVRVVGHYNENITDYEADECEQIADEFAIGFFEWIVASKAPLGFPSDVLLKMYKDQKQL